MHLFFLYKILLVYNYFSIEAILFTLFIRVSKNAIITLELNRFKTLKEQNSSREAIKNSQLLNQL